MFNKRFIAFVVAKKMLTFAAPDAAAPANFQKFVCSQSWLPFSKFSEENDSAREHVEPRSKSAS